MRYSPWQPNEWDMPDGPDTDSHDEEGGIQEVRDVYPMPLEDMDPDCREQWVYATQFCTALQVARRLGRGSGFGRNWKKCIYGMVSERCGGNKIDHDKSPKKPDSPKIPGGKR
jgi:hypothetical protein